MLGSPIHRLVAVTEWERTEDEWSECVRAWDEMGNSGIQENLSNENTPFANDFVPLRPIFQF